MAKKRTTGTGTRTRARQQDGEAEESLGQAPQPPQVAADDQPLTRADLLLLMKEVDAQADATKAEAPKKKGLLVQYWWVAVLLLIGAFFWYQNDKPLPGPGPEPRPSPDERADADLVTLATRAFRTRAAAEAFANASSQVADMLDEDGQSRTPSFTKRSQVCETLVAQLSRAAILTKLDVNREDFVEFVVAAWDEDKDFPQGEGPLSEEDRKQAAKQFRALSRAAQEVQ